MGSIRDVSDYSLLPPIKLSADFPFVVYLPFDMKLKNKLLICEYKITCYLFVCPIICIISATNEPQIDDEEKDFKQYVIEFKLKA